jgi:hypothetical protein
MKKRRRELPGHSFLLEKQKKLAADLKKKKKLAKELKKLSKEINQHRKNKDYEAAVMIANKLNRKLDEMGNKMMQSIDAEVLREALVALQAVHSASKEAVLIGLSVITFKNPFFR